MKKFRLYFNKDKETEWLNAQAKEGYVLTGFFAGLYSFDACTPGKYEHQIDFGDGFFSVSNKYREFMTEMGIEIVQCWGPWVFLRKEVSEEPFQLYTDLDSMVEHYTKIRNLFKIVTLVELICFILELCATLNGSITGFFFTLLIGLFLIVFMKVSIDTNDILLELKERKGETSGADAPPRGIISRFLPCGLILNAASYGVEHLPIENGELWASLVQITAIVIMMIGLFKSRHVFAK